MSDLAIFLNGQKRELVTAISEISLAEHKCEVDDISEARRALDSAKERLSDLLTVTERAMTMEAK